jgi:hypothetical protein
MRFISAALLLCCSLACAACTSPPDKEMNQARAAIEAARAAGADAYAPEEYKSAVAALKHSEDSVEQRDYRQALAYALDSREQAQAAVRTAASEKAAARSQSEAELRDLQGLLAQAQTRLRGAQGPRARRRILQTQQRTVDTADAAVQKARAAMARQDYLGARDAMRGVRDQLQAVIRQIVPFTEPSAPKHRR